MIGSGVLGLNLKVCVVIYIGCVLLSSLVCGSVFGIMVIVMLSWLCENSSCNFLLECVLIVSFSSGWLVVKCGRNLVMKCVV